MAKSPSRVKRDKDTVQDASTEQSIEDANTVATEVKRTSTMSEGSILEFSEDISNAEAPVPLPEGDYTAEIRAAEKKTSNNSGKDYAEVQFFIAPDQYPADYTEGDPDGQSLAYRRTSLEDTPAARYRLRKLIEAIGAKGGTKIDLNSWVGLTATVTIKHTEFEGEKRAEISKVVAP